MPPSRETCTKENPKLKSTILVRHPDAECVKVLNEYEERWRCPNCGHTWLKEGKAFYAK